MKEINKIKGLMMQSLEEVDEKGILQGEYVCHEDMIETPVGFDAQFVVCGEDENHTYLVLIQKVKI